MKVLPRSNPLYENIPAQKINLPDMLGKMGSGGFTGYLSFGAASAEAYALFVKGVMISVLLLEGERRKTGFEAINGLYDHILKGDGLFSIYRMTADIVMCTNALLNGETVLQPQEVRTVDLKALLAKMKVQMLNGTVLFSTLYRSAMIFYRDGATIGFYNDAANDIEASPTESQRVAALPGATLEIRSTRPVDILVQQNLLETINIDRLWEAATARNAARIKTVEKQIPESPPPAPQAAAVEIEEKPSENSSVLDETVEDLREIASAYLGRQGSNLVSTLLESGGGNSILNDIVKRTEFLKSISDEGLAIDSEAKIGEMVDLMQSEIAGRLSV